MKLHRLTLSLATALLLAACSNDDGTEPPPVGSDCPPATPLAIQVPAYFPEMPQPANNPMTVEGVHLGRLLFYDPILSADSTQSCGSCHLQGRSFADSRRFSEGVTGAKGTRHAPVLVNPAWTGMTFWDGRVHSLEEQATQPVPNEIEMNLPWPVAIQRLQSHPTYPDLFCATFGDKLITMNRVVKAIAQFERTFVSANSKYDQVRRGEATFTPEEAAGRALFNSEIGDCFHCHAEPLFTSACVACGNDVFQNTGLDSVIVDRGRFDVTGNPADMGKFKPPTLRNAFERFNYMHDGRFFNLREVINHYNLGFHDSDLVNSVIRSRASRRPMREGEIDTLMIFLETLTDPDFLTNPDLSNPHH